jgi:hypothetical protein
LISGLSSTVRAVVKPRENVLFVTNHAGGAWLQRPDRIDESAADLLAAPDSPNATSRSPTPPPPHAGRQLCSRVRAPRIFRHEDTPDAHRALPTRSARPNARSSRDHFVTANGSPSRSIAEGTRASKPTKLGKRRKQAHYARGIRREPVDGVTSTRRLIRPS